MATRIELTHRDHTFKPRTVKNMAEWAEKVAKELPVGTTMIIRKEKGTVQWRLQEARYWKFLRETFGP